MIEFSFGNNETCSLVVIVDDLSKRGISHAEKDQQYTYNRAGRPGDQYWDHYHGALSLTWATENIGP